MDITDKKDQSSEVVSFKYSGFVVPVIMVLFIASFLYQSFRVDNVLINNMVVVPTVVLILALLFAICWQELSNLSGKNKAAKPARFKKKVLNKQIMFYLLLVGYMILQSFAGFLISSAVMLIASFYLDFLQNEVNQGRLPKNLLPLQSGVGNIANAVLSGLLDSPFENLTSYTEVIQDGMVDLIDAGKLVAASATAFSLGPDYANKMNDNAATYAKTIVLRQQDISNHPEPIRRLGVLACNGLIEADIYGNVNSTHIMGSRLQNGIGGSGDFTRNAHISAFVTPSTAKGGAISAIVPMVSHHDHTEHDTHVIITEQGLADIRGMGPQQRAKTIIEKCAHPDYKEQLWDYFNRAVATANSQHTPHILRESLDFHIRFLETGTMKA